MRVRACVYCVRVQDRGPACSQGMHGVHRVQPHEKLHQLRYLPADAILRPPQYIQPGTSYRMPAP